MTEPKPPRAPIDLRRPRDVGALISDGFSVYFREFGTFLLIAVAVVVPVNLIVGGLGLGQFTGGYDATPSVAENVITLTTSFVVIAPLVTAMCIYALLEVADGKRPRPGPIIQRGLDIFPPLLLVILLYAGGVALGLFLLILPGIYLAVRWGFCVQAAVVEDKRGAEALTRSTQLVERSWWRVFGVILLANLLLGVIASLIATPFMAAADATDRAVYQLVGQTIGGVLSIPATALITTLLYFDQRVRKGT